ncbi:hypothetical protein [Desulfonema magnum]|uniref:Uncharacterized protein n=1 Tax=Desulfonema magnum TaxID=45655 RepID=A0A975BT77_9BACT|nr:hypothetical protein [Desulfonema magnum]QTA91191.1 Uncharacterized protein dnm_072560 [Desulfonema magnum]
MEEPQKYQKIEKELDKIIISELNNRFGEKEKNRNPTKINDILEKKNRELVTAHQNGRVASMIPIIFRSYLQIKEGGKLYFEKEDLRNKKEFEIYLGKKNRLRVLVNASLNALTEEDLIYIVRDKKKTFNDEYRKAAEVMELVRKAHDIRQSSDKSDLPVPRDEETAISYLREIAPLNVALQKIESRYIGLKQEPYLCEILQQLQRAINLGFKSITLQSKKASGFLFDQASAIFKSHKSVSASIASIESFMRQKEELVRYYSLFDSIGDENRKKQVESFISTIEATVSKIRKDIEKQKQRETAISEKSNQEIQEAYESFLDIKKMYAEGEFRVESKRKKAVSLLKKCQNILKANGHRIKARDIERFLNSTGIEKAEDTEYMPQAENLFYKRAFLTILPVTIFLGFLNIYQFISGYEAKESHKIALVEMQKKREQNALRYHHKTEIEEAVNEPSEK